MNRRRFVQSLGGMFGAGAWSTGFGLRARLGRMDGERFVERWSWVMGQAARITLFACDESAGLEAAAAAFAELRRVEAALSLFDGSSELVALNERAGRGAVRAGPDLMRVLSNAELQRRASGGAFNAAVEPLMRAWGFHAQRSAAPSAAELAEARAAVAATRLQLEARTVSLFPAHARLDLGGIGVGYGLDRAALVLRRMGIARGLLDISGDLLALGAPPGRAGWPVDIADPSGAGVIRTVSLCQGALATSANTASVVHYGALSCGHVLDPWSGQPARALRQVTIVADTAVAADASSTAMLVSGRRPPGVRAAIPVRG